MLGASIIAIMSQHLIRSAIYLAIASASVGIFMYLTGAVWAAVFEISVCSGLITVVFICAISLAKHMPKKAQDNKRMAFLPLILIIIGIVFIVLAMSLPSDFSYPAIQEDTVKDVLWNTRQSDIWGQMIVLLTGAAAIVVFFKERD